MNNLKFFRSLFFILITSPLFSQLSSDECLEQLSIFAESAKIKNYKAAYEPWKTVLDNCPTLNVATYQYGELILKDFIEKSTTEEEKTKYLTDLLSLYDQWLENFPVRKGVRQEGKILSNKGQAMLDNGLDDKSLIYDTFDYAFNNDPGSFTNPKSLAYYFQTGYDLYKDGTKIDLETLFEKYEELTEKFELLKTDISKNIDVILKKEESGTALTSREARNKRIYDTNSNAVSAYLRLIDQLIAKEATCDILIPLYSKNFEENKNNPLWIRRAAGRLDGKECSDDPLFVTLVEQLHKLEPSADSAYYLGILNDKQGNSADALKYYQESVSLQTDNYKKANILYKIAVKFKNSGRRSSARDYAEQALSFQPSLGRAYLLIANMYADSANGCGDTQFNKRAVFWLAAQTAQKAGRVDASLKKLTATTVAAYNGRAPSKTDIFTEGNQGATISFSCWIRRSVKVPNL
jgi:tetratricopeptide (TPR) repeat protein